jgi:predicted RNA-binding protein with PUA-like domain
MNYWLIKSEPFKYSWQDLEKDGETCWDGVRNYAARNNLKSMKKGDLCFFYHSNIGKEIVGIAKVVKTFYQDPTTDDTAWVSVNIQPFKKVNMPITLAQIKKEKNLKEMELVRLGRLSVQFVKEEEAIILYNLGGIK